MSGIIEELGDDLVRRLAYATDSEIDDLLLRERAYLLEQGMRPAEINEVLRHVRDRLSEQAAWLERRH